MGREIRKVPKDWQHPKTPQGQYIPLFDETYQEAADKWMKEAIEWHQGVHPDQTNPEYASMTAECRYYWEWEDPPSDPEGYLPDFGDTATCYQVYENTTEGTPVSPVFETLEALKEWLIVQGFDERAVDAFIQKRYAPSFTISNGMIFRGIESLSQE